MVAVVTYIFRKLVKGVVGVGVRQLAISLTGQHLRNHAAILVVGISNLIFPVDHGRQLVTLVVAHLQRSFYAVRAGQHLFGHVSGLVVGILLLVARALQEAGQLPQRVIGIGALRGLAALCAHLSRDVAVLVVAVAERNLARAAGRLREQIAYAVIAVCGCQGAARGFDSASRRVVGVAGHVPIQPRDAGHPVHAVVGVAHRAAVGVGHGGLVAVRIVGIGNDVTVHIRHGNQISLPVVLVNNRSLGTGNLRHHADFVVAAFHRLAVAHVLDEQAAGFVIFKCEHGSVCPGDAFQPPFRRVGILHLVAQRVGFSEQIAILVALACPVGIRHLFQQAKNKSILGRK